MRLLDLAVRLRRIGQIAQENGLEKIDLHDHKPREWIARLEPRKIWHAPVQGYRQIAEDPQVQHMRSLLTVPGSGATGAPVTLVNHPVLYDGTAAQVHLPPQPLGAQTEEVLKEIGLADAEIAALADAGVIKLCNR